MLQRISWIIVFISSLTLLVGNLVLGAVVAPTLFRVLGNYEAGLGFGNILRFWSEMFAWPVVVICVGALAVIFIIRLLRGHSNWFTAVAVLSLALLASHWWSNSLIHESIAARDELRNTHPLHQTPAVSDVDSRAIILKRHFDYLHRSSTRAFLVESATALLIVLLSVGALLSTAGTPGQSRRKDPDELV